MNINPISHNGKEAASALLSRDKLPNQKNDGFQDEYLPEIIFLSSYPPRECGLATYSQDLFKALGTKFIDSFSLKICALESGIASHVYPDEVNRILNTNDSAQYIALARDLNDSEQVRIVLVQHEFGFFEHNGGADFLQFLEALIKPVILVFHTVIPRPKKALRKHVRQMAAACRSMVVMTHNAAQVLISDYGVSRGKIEVIAHGTHLVPHLNKSLLKEKYGFTGRKVLSTFGLLGPGMGIETTLDSMPAIIQANPEALFLLIGKTHPGVIQTEGERYRNMLARKVKKWKLQNHVVFINRYLPLPDLLEYLQLTDLYLFTSKDPNQAVSGTFSYAMSCGCPVISTPIPHAREMLSEDTGIIIDFQDSQQLAESVNLLMGDDTLRANFSSSTLQLIVPTAWENSAIAHALLFQRVIEDETHKKIELNYRLPPIDLDHLQKMTTDFGFIQFSKINQPDISSGYTVDDNARALIAMCMHYACCGEDSDLRYMRIYLDFIEYCLQPDGDFLNYVDVDRQFTIQNGETNLSDANGRAIWALGYLVSQAAILPPAFIATAEAIMKQVLPRVEEMHSTRAMAFAIKGLYYYNLHKHSATVSRIIQTLADRLVQMYRHESEAGWQWYESYLTYANSLLPEALLCAWLDTGKPVYKGIAKVSFDFLLSVIFSEDEIQVISNESWLQKGAEPARHAEQPIDVAYTILALNQFYEVFRVAEYKSKMKKAFDWFLGKNSRHQIVYNPCTSGCYDGLEEMHVNLNQGAESTASYLMARLTLEAQQNVLPQKTTEMIPKAVSSSPQRAEGELNS